jgi:hypothetical protein
MWFMGDVRAILEVNIMSFKDRILNVVFGNNAVQVEQTSVKSNQDIFEVSEQQTPSIQRVVDSIKALHQDTFNGNFSFDQPVAMAGGHSQAIRQSSRETDYAGYGPKRSNYLRRRTTIKNKTQS